MRENFPLIRFGDVAREVREAEQNPLDNGLECLIGLEHIEPENLHIKEWGSVADGTSFTRVFRKGQVLFGKRRAYQRKVALAEFDGICSSDIIVMEAIEDKLVPELLPLIVQSEGFFEHALSTSAGSLSPRTKWKHLAEYKFPLPPKDEQRRIAEILWAADETMEKFNTVLVNLEKSYQAHIDDYYSLKQKGKPTPIRRIATINKESLSASKTDPDYLIRYIDIATIIGPGEIGTPAEFIFSEAPSRAKRIVSDGDILISMVRPYHRAFTKINNPPTNLIASTGIAVISPKHDVNTDYIYHSFFSGHFIKFCEARMTGTNYPAITPGDIEDFKIPLPSQIVQENISSALNGLLNSIHEVKNYIAILSETNKSLVDNLLGTKYVH
jgi:type I restriction enzyme, S subunit